VRQLHFNALGHLKAVAGYPKLLEDWAELGAQGGKAAPEPPAQDSAKPAPAPSIPRADPCSDRFRGGERENKFLAVAPPLELPELVMNLRRIKEQVQTALQMGPVNLPNAQVHASGLPAWGRALQVYKKTGRKP